METTGITVRIMALREPPAAVCKKDQGKQMRNAMAMLCLARGIPLIWSGMRSEIPKTAITMPIVRITGSAG